MTRALLLAVLMVSTIWSAESRAEQGALAIGTTGDVNKDGWVWGAAWGADAKQKALDSCRGVISGERLPENTTKVRKLCRIYAEFQDKCLAIAQDGNIKTPATGMGWGVHPGQRSAEAEALSKCEAMTGPARRAACKVEYSEC